MMCVTCRVTRGLYEDRCETVEGRLSPCARPHDVNHGAPCPLPHGDSRYCGATARFVIRMRVEITKIAAEGVTTVRTASSPSGDERSERRQTPFLGCSGRVEHRERAMNRDAAIQEAVGPSCSDCSCSPLRPAAALVEPPPALVEQPAPDWRRGQLPEHLRRDPEGDLRGPRPARRTILPRAPSRAPSICVPALVPLPVRGEVDVEQRHSRFCGTADPRASSTRSSPAATKPGLFAGRM